MNPCPYLINRELSWLNFNARVLDEARCEATPLLERLKFIAIFNSNLDEFFMVRIAGVRQLVLSKTGAYDATGISPADLLEDLDTKIRAQQKLQECILTDVLSRLADQGIEIVPMAELSTSERKVALDTFTTNIRPLLTPLAVDPSHPFPVLTNGMIVLAVTLASITKDKDETQKAFVELPALLPRFIPVAGKKPRFILLEDLVHSQLQTLFTGRKIIESLRFRVTRDMDFAIEDSDAEDLMKLLEKKILQRKRREPIRLEIEAGGDKKLRKWLLAELHQESILIYDVPRMLYRKQFFELVGKAARADLLEPAWPPLPVDECSQPGTMFEAIQEHHDILVALPYQTFAPLVRLLQEAADDPNVIAIKQTLYRVSGNSPVVAALERAAKNGKLVTVIVELKARFDEANNITWARRLESAGAHVVYGVSRLKIHCKALLIIRREEDDIHRYVHLSTGNYNDKTATLYTDMGYFSDNETLTSEVSELFNIMTGYSLPEGTEGRAFAAPFDLRRKVLALIDREARLSTPQNPGLIQAKMNSLSDPEVIEHLHKAAEAGVKIDLIVRGICCLKPDNENIHIISIVDRFLEHTRMFHFQNGGHDEYYLSSADWMTRNLDKRIELLFSILRPEDTERLQKLFDLQLADTEKARRLYASGVYSPRTKVDKHDPSRSQQTTYAYFKSLHEAKAQLPQTLTILRHHKDTNE